MLYLLGVWIRYYYLQAHLIVYRAQLTMVDVSVELLNHCVEASEKNWRLPYRASATTSTRPV